MRAISKIMTVSAIAAAALAVSACGSKTEPTTDNTTITDLNATEGLDTTTDNMTAVDATTNTGVISNDAVVNETAGNAN